VVFLLHGFRFFYRFLLVFGGAHCHLERQSFVGKTVAAFF